MSRRVLKDQDSCHDALSFLCCVCAYRIRGRGFDSRWADPSTRDTLAHGANPDRQQCEHICSSAVSEMITFDGVPWMSHHLMCS